MPMNIRTYLDNLPVGGKTNLAKTIGVSSAYLYQMGAGIRPVPGPLCRTIENATNGAVTVHDLRPDIFGHQQDATKAAA